jgi:hypothetical protein
MTSLENRLQETEAALSAAMNALRGRGEIGAIEAPVEGGVGRSKAERQKEWKRWPLGTGEEIGKWSVEKEQRNVRAHDEHGDGETSAAHAASDIEALHDAMDQLKSCRRPTVPNVSCSPTSSVQWINNYF